ncbi:MAG: hypothetical protein IKJ05_07855 [Oscillospiraceae bacterium]|nr:hypothetical protein [Oscillospiraceae bacterium]
MTGFAMVTSVTGVLFLSMIMYLAMRKESYAKVTGFCIAVAGISGLFIYGYGFSIEYADSFPLAVIHCLMAVWGMFVSKNNFAIVSGTPLFASQGAVVFFWVVHLMAQYATASAAIATIGARALRRLRLWMACFGCMSLIYGINEDSVAFGRQLAAAGKNNVVFVDDKAPDSLAGAINSFGGVIISDKNALWPDRRFLRGLGIRGNKREYNFYLLHKTYAKNVKYAFALKDALAKNDIASHLTSLVMLGEEETHAAPLQAFGEDYGFGNVSVFDGATLVSRLLIHHFPPAATMTFNADGSAAEDFESVIIGFGNVGQSVMKQLVMNGQFAGSDFSLAVFAPDFEKVSGYITATSHSITDNYNISYYNYDGRSRQMYDYILSRKDSMNYIVICTGNEKTNSEIGGEITRYLARIGSRAQVYLAGYSGISCLTDGNIPPKQYPVFTTDVLCTGRLDTMAALLNHSYCKNDKTPVENWTACDWFSRMSNRASADFMPSMAIIAGKDPYDRSQWNLTETQLENLGKTEHMRWMAFHFVMGYERMPEAVYRQREKQYLQEKALYGTGRIRVGKDTAARQHACLIPWEDLDALSARENSITGGNTDYKSADIANVLAIPQLYSTLK